MRKGEGGYTPIYHGFKLTRNNLFIEGLLEDLLGNNWLDVINVLLWNEPAH